MDDPDDPRRGSAEADPGAPERDLLVLVGEALTIAGESIDGVRDRLLELARRRNDVPVEMVVLPTAVWVQTGSEAAARSQFVSFTNRTLRLDQVSRVYELFGRILDPSVDAADAIRELEAIMAAPPPFPRWVRALGHGILALGFSLSLQPSLVTATVAFTLGVVVGLIDFIRLPGLRSTAPVMAAFVVSLFVFEMATHLGSANPIRMLIPPLVTFLPGAVLTTGMRDLASGQLISGVARFGQGIVVLMMLAVGIVAAATLVGTPSSELLDRPVDRLGPWAPWVGLALVTLGTHFHRCVQRAAMPWIFAVLVVTYSAQLLAATIFAPELSAFFGAVAMTAAAMTVERLPSGPPSPVTFLPSFWALVPGAAGLIGVTAIVGTDSTLGPSDFLSTLGTVLEIALGVLIGSTLFYAGSETIPEITKMLPRGDTAGSWWRRFRR